MAKSTTFEKVAHEWIDKTSAELSEGYVKDIRQRLNNYAFPDIGDKPINEITVRDLVPMVNKMLARGIVDTCRRVLQECGQVFCYDIRTGRCDTAPSIALKGTLPPKSKRHNASITHPKKVAELLRAMDGYSSDFTTRCALKLSALLYS